MDQYSKLNTVENIFLIDHVTFSLNICEYYKYYQYQYYYKKQKNHTRIHLIMLFFMLSTVKSNLSTYYPINQRK